MRQLVILESVLLKKHWMAFVLAFLLPLLAIFWWWGGFNPVAIKEAQRGPYRYAYLEHSGDYAKLHPKQQQVFSILKAQGIKPGLAITVLFDDPRTTVKSRLNSRTGYVVEAQAKVGAPLKVADIPARQVTMAQVQAVSLLAPSKAYQALDGYLKARHLALRMPAVELYESPEEVYRIGEFTVEMTP